MKGVSLVDYSSETSAHPARNLLDGNNQCVQVGTLSHYYDSSWSTSDTDQKYVIFKLDNPAVLTAVDYIPAVQGIGWAHDNIANGALYSGDLYTSEDGVAWDLVSSLDGLQYSGLSSNNVKKTFEIPLDKQKLVSYVKVVARETYYSTYVNLTEPAGHHYDENQVFSARAFEFYQDSTKNSVLTGVVSYSEENPTNQSVTARVGNLSTQNAEVIGEDTVTFEENGSHTFTFEEKDAEGKVVKTGTATAVVDWIDKEEPKAHIEYSTTSPTGGLVLATLSVDEKGSEKSTLELYTTKGEWTPLTEIDEDLALPPGDRRKKFQVSPYEATFNENGTYSFALRDKAGNSRTYEARVNWILTSAPETVVTYSTTSPTGKSVTATLSCPSGKISPVEGGSLTHIFTANGDYEFRYLDAAGNEWTAAASVDWIDLEPPAAHVEYSPARVKGKETRGPVTATLVLDSAEEVTVLGDGQMSHTFNRNGVHLFRLRDGAGNVTTVKAEVTWIGGAS